jgi:FMN phosphatase YigB (HAD superfamily)
MKKSPLKEVIFFVLCNKCWSDSSKKMYKSIILKIANIYKRYAHIVPLFVKRQPIYIRFLKKMRLEAMRLKGMTALERSPQTNNWTPNMIRKTVQNYGQHEYDLVKKSGLFDENFYKERISDLPAGKDPLAHYLESDGWDIPASPLFNGAYYLLQNPDVAESGWNPLIHYVQFGRTEGRSARMPHMPGRTDRTILPRNLNISKAQLNSSFVVVVHAFYPELFEEVVTYLKNVPIAFTLCVGVPTNEGKALVEDIFNKANLNATLDCRIAKNRGRNFGTLVSLFGEEVKKHDILLHVHTKKSLYRGTEQCDWRQAIFNGLMGNAELISTFLYTFNTNRSVGILYPTAFSGMPYWGYHWLSNGGVGRYLLDRLGFPHAKTSGYLDYPIGGMFWARVDAIRPLFEANITYDDFPPEEGQIDGTIAHAIERAVSVISKERGYEFVEYDAVSDTLRYGWSTRLLEQYLNLGPDAFNHAIAHDSFQLISFDIFDTVLTRKAYEPDAVMRYAGHRLMMRFPLATNFFEKRKNAEHKAREIKAFQGDVGLNEIYDCFERNDIWTPEVIKTARDLECETDLRTMMPRDEIVQLVRNAKNRGIRVVAISDTYYELHEIVRILETLGLGDLFDHLYVSSAEQARKDRRDLYPHVKEKENVSYEHWLHVGDNEQSDMQVTGDYRMRHFHVMRPPVLLDSFGFHFAQQKSTDAPKWVSELLIGPAMMRLLPSAFCLHPQTSHANGTTLEEKKAISLLDRPLLDSPKNAGYVVFGPIIFAFLSWIIRHQDRPKNKIFFLAREGYSLTRIYNSIREMCPELNLPEGSYLFASRRALLSAVQVVHPSLDKVVSGFAFNGTFADLVEGRLGMKLKNRSSYEWPVDIFNEKELILQELQKLLPEIEAHSQKEMDNYIAYLKQENFDSEEMPTVVDIGYSGTIQTCIQDILNKPLKGFYFGTHVGITQVKEKGGVAYGYEGEEIEPTQSNRGTLMMHPIILEAFLTAPHGQLESFTREEGRLVPVFKKERHTKEWEQMLEDLHEGAHEYCVDMIKTYGPEFLSFNHNVQDVSEFYRLFMNGLFQVPESIRDHLHIEDDFCGNGDVNLFQWGFL